MTGDMNAVPKDMIRIPVMTTSLPESTVGLRSGPNPMMRRPAMRMMKPIRYVRRMPMMSQMEPTAKTKAEMNRVYSPTHRAASASLKLQ